MNRCPVCTQPVAADFGDRIARHRNSLGKTCTCGTGEPYRITEEDL